MRTKVIYYLSVLSICALLVLPTMAFALHLAPFSGRGQATDIDGSDIPMFYEGGDLTEANILVNTSEDELNEDGDCSLREAIQAANTDSAVDTCLAGSNVITDTITFSANGTFTLSAQLDISAGSPLVIDGGEAIAISGEDSVRIFYVNNGADLTLESLTIMDGRADNGGGLHNAGDLTVIGSTLSSNYASNKGGGIYNIGTLTVVDSALSGNSAYFGGGIYNLGGLIIVASTLTANSATSSVNWPGCRGGAIYNESGSINLVNSTLMNNIAPSGGGIYNQHGILTIVSSTFSSNHAHYDGGGIESWGGGLTISSSTFSSNSADLGGGIYSAGGFGMRNSILAGNTSTFHGPNCSVILHLMASTL